MTGIRPRVQVYQSGVLPRHTVWIIPQADGTGWPNRDLRDGQELPVGIRVTQPTRLRQIRHVLQVGQATCLGHDSAYVGERASHPRRIQQKGIRVERVVRQQAGVHAVHGGLAGPIIGSDHKDLGCCEGSLVQAELGQPAMPGRIIVGANVPELILRVDDVIG